MASADTHGTFREVNLQYMAAPCICDFGDEASWNGERNH